MIGQSPQAIYTVGHSTRTIGAFVTLLRVHHVTRLADIRTMPRSSRHPQFGSESLAASLLRCGIAYRHFPALGGFRKPLSDSVNTAWRSAGFRGYADHMQTETFDRGVAALLEWAAEGRTAVMCAEAVWWRCHRALLGDALVARGLPVRHILSEQASSPHRFTEFAQERDGQVTYSGLPR